MTPEMVVNYLLNLAASHKLIELAVTSCDAWFENEGCQIEGWTSEELQKQFFSHSLTFKCANWDMVYIDTRLDLLTSSRQQIGCYRLITTLDGDVDDDYLIIDCTKAEYEQRCKLG